MHFPKNRLAFAFSFIAFLITSSVARSAITKVATIQKSQANYDVALHFLNDTIPGCIDYDYKPKIKVINHSSVYVNDIPLKLISNQDTVSEVYGIYLNPGDSAIVTLHYSFTPIVSGDISVQITLDTTDDDLTNNLITLTYQIQERVLPDFEVKDVCAGEEMILINTTTYAGKDSLKYEWFIGDGTRYSDKDLKVKINGNPYITSSYTVGLRSRTNTCMYSISKDVTIHAVSDPSFSSKLIGKDLIISNQATVDLAGVAYIWEFGDGKRSYHPSPTHTYDSVGQYEVCLTLINKANCVSSSCVLNVPISTITGQTYIDVDNNCRFNGEDIPIQAYISAKTETSIFDLVTSETGMYKMNVNSGQEYVVKSNNLNVSTFGCGSDSLKINNAVQDSNYIHDFVYRFDSTTTDFGVTVGNSTVIRGRSCTVSITVASFGLSNADSLEIDLWYDSTLMLEQASSSHVSLDKGHMRFKIQRPELSSNEVILITFTDKFGDLKRGDTVEFVASLVSNDDNKYNNSDTSRTSVLAAYDPNAKTSFPSGAVTEPVSSIRYIIEFQNIGDVSAKDVVVYDVLDKSLPAKTIRITGTSHPNHYSTEIKNGVLKWTFKDIYLADSASDPEGSKGFIAFEVEVVPGYQKVGDTIHNKATIYFDFEDGIETNDAIIFLVDENAGVEHLAGVEGYLYVYPNPTNGLLVVKSESDEKHKLTLVNLTGVHLKTFDIEAFQELELDVQEYADGVYFLQDERGHSLKFIKH